MGERAHGTLAWGFEVKNDYSNEMEELFEKGDVEKHGCAFENHDELGPSFVYVKELHYDTDWDDILPIDIKVLIENLPGTSAEKALRTFCEELGIPWKEPGWFLAAYQF